MYEYKFEVVIEAKRELNPVRLESDIRSGLYHQSQLQRMTANEAMDGIRCAETWSTMRKPHGEYAPRMVPLEMVERWMREAIAALVEISGLDNEAYSVPASMARQAVERLSGLELPEAFKKAAEQTEIYSGWSVADQAMASAQGWAIFDGDSGLRIEHIDSADDGEHQLMNDGEAWAIVLADIHAEGPRGIGARALAVIKRENEEEYERIKEFAASLSNIEPE